MKRLHFILIVLAVMLGCASAHAESWGLQASAFSMRTFNKYTHKWNEWSKWEPCTVYMKFDGDQGKLTIYSEEVQVYNMYNIKDFVTDRDGDSSAEAKFKDQDGDLGSLLFVKKANGGLEVYIYYNTIAWAYIYDVL